jgi:hypothetical protein
VSASSSASAAAAAAAVQHNSVVTVSQEASLDELVQPLTAEEAEVSTYSAISDNTRTVPAEATSACLGFLVK